MLVIFSLPFSFSTNQIRWRRSTQQLLVYLRSPPTKSDEEVAHKRECLQSQQGEVRARARATQRCRAHTGDRMGRPAREHVTGDRTRARTAEDGGAGGRVSYWGASAQHDERGGVDGRARRWAGERARKMAWASGASGQAHATVEAQAGGRAHRTAGERGRARRRIPRALPVPSRARNHWFLPNGEMVISSRLGSRVDVVSSSSRVDVVSLDETVSIIFLLFPR